MSFWNKVQSGVSRAAAEAEKQARITRVNMQIADVQGTINRKQQELGEAALKLIREGKLSETSFDAIVASIDAEETRLAGFREQLAEVQGAGATSEASAEQGAEKAEQSQTDVTR